MATTDVKPDDNAYDTTPYKSNPFPQSHPDRLATIGTLFGMNPTPIDRCRVLELGCASGGNLMPIANQYPHSKCLGIDYSARQINDGCDEIKKIGLENIELQSLDILEFPLEGEPFDYIICHGVFSWVPDEIQQRILQICQKRLSPNGIAYISYNTHPGWRMRGMIRDIMRYRARNFDTPESQLSQARGLLKFLSNSVNTENNAYGILLKNELESISKSDDYYLLHEQLEEINDPLYFHEFVERAAEQDLQYLGEAHYGVMSLENFPEDVRGMLQSVSRDLIETEQYMDFLRNRVFRQTLLCHRNVSLNRNVTPRHLMKMRVASSTRAEGEVDLNSSDPTTFTRGPSVLTSNDPVVKAAMLHLWEIWPKSIPFAELASIARSAVSKHPVAVDTEVMSRETEELAQTILRCFETSQIDLHLSAPPFVNTVCERPVASALSRNQAIQESRVTNRLHESVFLDDLQRQVLRDLDGSHNEEELINRLTEKSCRGDIVIHHENRRLTREEDVRAFITEAMPHILESLAHKALLIE